MKLVSSKTYFKQAASKNASAPEVNANLGLCELVKDNVAAAETYLGKATGANAAGEALGNLYIKQGQYDRAVNSFGDAKTNSAAQAQILAKDYNKAKATLSAIKNPDAMTDYLMAIVGARTNNASLVSSSIKSAIAKDPSMAEKAANDREFAKYTDAIKCGRSVRQYPGKQMTPAVPPSLWRFLEKKSPLPVSVKESSSFLRHSRTFSRENE